MTNVTVYQTMRKKEMEDFGSLLLTNCNDMAANIMFDNLDSIWGEILTPQNTIRGRNAGADMTGWGTSSVCNHMALCSIPLICLVKCLLNIHGCKSAAVSEIGWRKLRESLSIIEGDSLRRVTDRSNKSVLYVKTSLLCFYLLVAYTYFYLWLTFHILFIV